MRKAIFTLALLVIALAAGAQTIKVDFHKGDVRKYLTTADMSMGLPMRGTEKGTMTVISSYTVTGANANGYTVDYKVDSLNLEGGSGIISKVADFDGLKALQQMTVKLVLDKNGAITDLQNSDEVLSAMAKVSIESINDLYEKNPGIEKMVPKSKALMAVNDKITKENALKTLRENTIFELNGKNIKPGEEVDETMFENLKIKSTYSVDGTAGNLTISKTAVSNMQEDDIKAFLKQQMSQMGAVSDADFDAAWSQLKAFGMTKVDIDQTASSSYGAGGWLTKQTSDGTVKAMGANVKVISTTKAL